MTSVNHHCAWVSAGAGPSKAKSEAGPYPRRLSIFPIVPPAVTRIEERQAPDQMGSGLQKTALRVLEGPMAVEVVHDVEGSPYQSVSGYEVPRPARGTGDAVVLAHWRSPHKVKIVVRIGAKIPRQDISKKCRIALRIDVERHHLPPKSLEGPADGTGTLKQLKTSHLP